MSFRRRPESCSAYVVIAVQTGICVNSHTMQHTIDYRQSIPALHNDSLAQGWLEQWRDVALLSIDQVRGESHVVRPQAEVKLLHDGERLVALFRVCEAGVISRETQINGQVWRDSCVEIFLQPPEATGYFNFECNAGGCVHASFVTNWQRNAQGDVSQRRLLAAAELQQLTICHSLAAVIDSPLPETTSWYLAISIPLSLLQRDVPTADFYVDGWRGNLYKCAEHGPYPHWLSWSPLTQLNFHAPDQFGQLYFETVPV